MKMHARPLGEQLDQLAQDYTKALEIIKDLSARNQMLLAALKAVDAWQETDTCMVIRVPAIVAQVKEAIQP
jgi:hypothetical protein